MYEFDVLAAGERDEVFRGGRLQTGAAIQAALDAIVSEIPRGPALTLSPETAVSTAVEAMRARHRGAAIVVRNHRPVGVLTDRDILASEGARSGELRASEGRALTVESVMSPCPRPLRFRDTIATALHQMTAQRQWCLPIVCDEGLLLGGLDAAEICAWLGHSLTQASVEAFFAGRS